MQTLPVSEYLNFNVMCLAANKRLIQQTEIVALLHYGAVPIGAQNITST